MVNNTLRRVDVLGVWDRVIGFWQSGVKHGAVIAVLSAALLGCSGSGTSLNSDNDTEIISDAGIVKEKPQTDLEKARAHADSQFLANHQEYSEQAMDFSNFTIEGKPTKTIITPRGSVEIYDPTQDEYVRSRFAMYKQANYPSHSPFKMDLHRLNRILLKEYRKNYCSIITDGQCYTWDYKGCEGPQPYNCMNLPPGAALKYTCSMGNHQHNILDYKKITDLGEAMSKYFKFECHEWKK
jgi:hypothetical protein